MLKKQYLASVFLALLLLITQNVQAAPGTTVVSVGIENAYGQLPEVDGFSDLQLQNTINANIKVILNDLKATVRGQAELNYSYEVLTNTQEFLSILVRADSNDRFSSARGINIDLKTGNAYNFNELFNANDDFFAALEGVLGWRPVAETAFAVSPEGLVFINHTGQRQVVGYENIFKWVVISKAGYYLDAYRITSSADGRLINISVGNMLVVLLQSNKSTGYAWQIKNNEYTKILESMGTSYLINSTAVGSGGWEMFLFGVTQKGEATLTLDYKRNWETKPIKTITIQIDSK